MNNTQSPNNLKNGQEPMKTIHIKVSREFLDKQDALWATETKHTRKTVLVVVGCFVAIALLSGFIPILGKLPLTPLFVIYIIYRYHKGKELKKRNHEELMEFQEQLRAKKAKTEPNIFAGSYVTEESYDEYQARKQAEEEEMILMQEAYDQEEERLQRLEEEWQAQQALFQEIHGDHYDN